MPRKYDIDDKVVGISGKFKYCKGVIIDSNTSEKGITKYEIEFEILDKEGQLSREKVIYTKNSFRRSKDHDVQEGAQSLLHIGAKRTKEHTLEDAEYSSDEEENNDHIIRPVVEPISQPSVGDLITQHILRPLYEHPKYQDAKAAKAGKDRRVNARVACVVCTFVARSYCVKCSEKNDCIVAVHNPFPITDPGDIHRATACYIAHITTSQPEDK
ncbi:hypothetical protein EON65_04005 [archaeon]|nr:MAG: hypothetical protein EON65_04005 [archaeon]